MKFIHRLFLAAALVLTFGISVAAAPRVGHVFIISIDGGKPAVIKQSKMPNLFKLVSEGAHSWQARTIFPSITLISHVSMLTGVGPDKHKISWNDWEPSKGIVQVPTVFSVAKKANRNISTALIFGKQKFLTLTIPGSFDTLALPAYQTEPIASTAAHLIRDVKPTLCFIHFAAGDGAGHAHGWGSDEQKQAFADVDRGLKTIFEAIKRAGMSQDSVVIISADHGGHDKTHGSSSYDDMTIPWIAWGKGVKPAYIITDPVTTYDTAATALWLLDIPIPAEWDGKPVTSAFTQ